MYWFLIDIVLIIVVAVCVVSCAQRGFVASLIRLLGVVLALVAASVLSRMLAPVIFDRWFREELVQSLGTQISAVGLADAYSMMQAVLSGSVGIIIGIFGGEGRLESFLRDGFAPADGYAAAEQIVDGVVRPSYEAMIQVAVFVVGFILVICLIAIIAKITRAVNLIPVLGTFNRVLGAVFGVVYGACICFIVVAIFAFVFTVIGRNADYNRIVTDNTILFSLFYRNNPLLRG